MEFKHFLFSQSDQSKNGFIVGTWWFADLYFWDKIAVTIFQDPAPSEPVLFAAEHLKINNKVLLDWFTNYLLENHAEETEESWHEVNILFESKQTIFISDEVGVECVGIQFKALRSRSRKGKLVGLSGDAFFDWQKKQIKFPTGAKITTHAVEVATIVDWPARPDSLVISNDFIQCTLIAHMKQFAKVDDVIPLHAI